MGLRFWGYLLEVCVVLAEVGDLEGPQVRSALFALCIPALPLGC